MKQIIIGLLLSLFVAGVSAQQFVTKLPQHKNVVLEEFTGVHCGYCPDGHARAQALSDANPGRVVLINIHAGGYAVPNAHDRDFRTPYGEAIDDLAGVTGYPAGTVNRHIFPEIDAGKTAMSRSSWSYAAPQIFPQLSPVNVGFKSSFDTATRELSVDVELYYPMSSPASTNYVHVVLLENHVRGYQSNYASGADSNYDHKHIMRDLFTGQWGETVTTTTAGSYYSKTFTSKVSADYNIDSCDVAVFVTESKQEIYTGVVDKALNGYQDGVTELYAGNFKTSGEQAKNVSNGSNTSFSFDATTFINPSEEFKFRLKTDAPSDWTGTFEVDGSNYSDSATVLLKTNLAKQIKLNVSPGTTPAFATYRIEMEPVNYKSSVQSATFYVVSGITDLVVSNSAGWGSGEDVSAADFADRFVSGLSNASEKAFDNIMGTEYLIAAKDKALSGVQNIYYNVGWSFPSLSDELVGYFQDFLDNGGNMMISGQDIGWDNWDANGYGSDVTKAFLENYFNFSFVDDGSTANNKLESSGEELYKNVASSAIVNMYGKDDNGTAYMYPDVVLPQGDGIEVFRYSATKTAAVRSNSSSYKTFFMGVSLEMIKDEAVRNEIMKITHDWFHGIITTDIFDQKAKALNFYPNPANSLLTLDSEPGSRIQIIDMDGKIVLEIAETSEKLHTIDVSILSAGTYIVKEFYKNGNVAQSKLIVQ